MSLAPVRVIVLSGGVGGARLVDGLHRGLPAGHLAALVNTGDDFVHLGLHVSPDVDTVTYTLAGLANPVTGWGRRDESWHFMDALTQLGGPTWFRLGDRDLAMHAERSRRLAAGESLSLITLDLATKLGVSTAVIPMTDDAVRTRVHTGDGSLDFQDYFVRLRAEPRIERITFEGIADARPAAAALEAIASPQLEVIVVGPSNPYLSVDPILTVPGLRNAMRLRGVPIVAVCPLIGGQAVKGPTAKIMQELGLECSPRAIAEHYSGLIDGLLIDEADRDWADLCGVPTCVTRTLMDTDEARVRLAREVVAFAGTL